MWHYLDNIHHQHIYNRYNKWTENDNNKWDTQIKINSCVCVFVCVCWGGDLELSQVTHSGSWNLAIMVAEEEEEGELADGK